MQICIWKPSATNLSTAIDQNQLQNTVLCETPLEFLGFLNIYLAVLIQTHQLAD